MPLVKIRLSLIRILLISLLPLSAHCSNDIDNDDVNPFMDIASSFLQNAMQGQGQNGNGLAALGGLLGNLMQGEGGQQLGDLFMGQNNKNDLAGDLLSGLGSLMANKNSKIDPSMIGSMISMFAQQMGNANEPNHAQKQNSRRTRRQSEQENEIDFSGILNVASSFLENGQNGGGGIFPVLMDTINSFSAPQVQERAHKHADHAWFLPPVLEKIHVYWDQFLNSELGKSIWKKSGLENGLKSFAGKDGKVDFELVLKSLENHSFRRRWIKTATAYLTEFFVYLSTPEVHQRYLNTAQYIINNFLKSQNFPKHVMFNTAKASDSLSALANHVAQKYLNVDTDLSIYVKPAVTYIQQVIKMAQATSSRFLGRTDHNALSDRLTDTLNLEIIEPVLRVYRAYRHSVRAPHCQEHLMCIVNRHDDYEKLGLPGFKAGLTKLSSMVASAALSYQRGRGFWDLYNAIQNDVNCEAKYPADCSDFHEHEIKVTTEYYHNEL